MNNPPSTTSSPWIPRRALLTGLAALAAVTPVGIAGSSAGTTAAQSVHAESSSQPVRFAVDGTLDGLQLPDQPIRTGVEGIQGLTSSTLPAIDLSGVPQVTAPAEPTTTTTVAPTPPTTAAPAPTSAPASADPNDPATWDRLAKCESGGNWATNTGNGYYGGLQFSASTWRAVGGSGLPHQNSREVQIEMGRRLQARSGWGQWPACTRKLGYR